MNSSTQKKSQPNIVTGSNSLGFTLIELLVSVSIIGLMSTLIFTNYRQSGVGIDLTSGAQQLASKIRVAQNYSLGTEKFNNLTPLGGWGIHFDTANLNSGYILFADKDGNRAYDSGEAYSTTTLPVRIKIDKLTIGSSTQESVIDVVFSPPDPRTYINNNHQSSMFVTLKEDINNTTKRVEINFLGLIDVVN